MVCNIVACTANTTSHWKKLAKDCGMLDIVNKPLTPAKLNYVLNNYFDEQNSQSALERELEQSVCSDWN